MKVFIFINLIIFAWISQIMSWNLNYIQFSTQLKWVQFSISMVLYKVFQIIWIQDILKGY
jgi:hypothetical protein